MSWKRGQKDSRRKKSAWSGGSDSQEAPRHRWQDATSSTDVGRKRRRRSRNRWVVVTAIALALLAWLIVSLLPIPRTPFVLVMATDYKSPIPINSWAMEDGLAIEELNRKNLELPTKHLINWNDDGSSFELIPSDFDLNQYKLDLPLIIYLSAHGVVKEDGQPCVLPPRVSINDPKKWIVLEKLLDDIHTKVSEKRDTLLVLDCNHIRENWSLGIVYNTFADRVKELVNRKKLPRLAVLTSAGPGQVSWTSADFRGSVFARYLQLGLAGAADRKESGNKNSTVSLKELASYLQDEVSAWSQSNRGEKQEPMLLPDNVEDFIVTNSVRSGVLDRLVNRWDNPESPESHEATETNKEDLALWSQFDNLRERNLIRCDPIACSIFEHQLLRLEELSQGGKAYENDAKELRRDVKDGLKEATESAKNSADSLSVADFYGLVGGANWLRINSVGFNLPACEYFGVCNAKRTEKLRGQLEVVANKQSSNAADLFGDKSDTTKELLQLAETQFLAAVGQQQVKSVWLTNLSHVLPDVLALRTEADKLAVPREDQKPEDDKKPRDDQRPGDERAHYFARFALDQADANRRRVEDLLFVGQQGVPKQYEKDIRDTSALNASARKVMQDASEAFRVRDEVFAEGPYLAEWLCDPLCDLTDWENHNGSKLASRDLKDREPPLRTKLVPLFEDAQKLSKVINKELHKREYVRSGGNLEFSTQADQLQKHLNEIREKHLDVCKKLAELKLKGEEAEKTVNVANWRQLDAILRTPLVSAETRAELLETRAFIATKLNAKGAAENGHENDETPDASDEGDKSPASYFDVVRKWKPNPLLTILSKDAPKSEQPVDTIDKINAAARDGLKMYFSAESEKTGPAGAGETDAVAATRDRLSAMEAEVRAKAALNREEVEPEHGAKADQKNEKAEGADNRLAKDHGDKVGLKGEQTEVETAKGNVIDQLRRFDILQLLIWNGRRATGDFWQSTVDAGSLRPYFERAASGFFQAAHDLDDRFNEAVAKQIKNEEAKLAAYSAYSERLPITSAIEPAPRTEGAFDVSLDIGSEADPIRFPEGNAAIYLRAGFASTTRTATS